LASKLFSLIGGVATGLLVTMAVVIPMPGRQMPVLTVQSLPVPAPRPAQVKELSDQTPTVAQEERQPAFARPQEQPLHITPSPVLTTQSEATLPDQTGRNLVLQQQTRPVEPNRVTHQLAQAWQPANSNTPRYLPHTASGNHPRRPDPGQPGFTGRDGRNPRPPEGPEPASSGN
jgi:hypothetical protein